MRPARGRYVGVALTFAVIGAFGGAADAHTGTKAQLYVESARIEPGPDGWSALVEVRDADSGQLEPGYDVTAGGRSATAGSFEPVSLADPDDDGRYEAALPLGEGDWSITVEAKQFTTGDKEALPYAKTWDVTFRAGEALELTSGAPVDGGDGDGGGASGGGLVIAALGLAAVVGLVVAMGRRRRSPEAVRT